VGIIDSLNFINIIHHRERPNAKEYIENIFPSFIEICGDRLYGDDPSVIGGLAEIDGIPVTVIAQQKGRTIKEHIKYNFSMSKPEGYRKILRLMKQAEKFRRPVICFVDTLGAYPGKEAEERGQGNAIANCLMEAMNLKMPIMSFLLGDGASGGALALCIADQVIALENATLSVITPKACANILWKDSSRELEAANLLRMKSNDLFEFGVVDKIIDEPGEGAHTDPKKVFNDIYLYIITELYKLIKISPKKLVRKRNEKYSNIGISFIRE